MTELNPLRAGLLAAAVAVLGAGAASAAPAARPADSCFFVNQWQGWKSPTPDVLYLKVSLHDVYKVGLSGGSSWLQSPGVHLVSKVRGSSSICSALDLDLAVSDGHGFSEPLFPRTLTRLTPEEIAAIPPKFRP